MNGSKAKFLRRVAGGVPLPPVMKPLGRFMSLILLIGNVVPGPSRRAVQRFLINREIQRALRESQLRKQVYRYIKNKAKKEKVT